MSKIGSENNLRGMTSSSILQIPSVLLLLIVCFAGLVTIMLTGKVSDSPTPNALPSDSTRFWHEVDE